MNRERMRLRPPANVNFNAFEAYRRIKHDEYT